MQNPPLTVRVSRSITEIDRNKWEGVYPDIPEGYAFLKTCEETLKGQFNFYYISIYDAKGLVFVASCFVLDYPLETTLDEPLQKLFSAFRKIIPRFFICRAVVCGSPACEGRLGIKNPSDHKEMIKILTQEMSKIAKKERASTIAFKEFSDEYTEILKPLLGMKFHKVPTLPSVEMDIKFKSFDEYFNSLSAATKIDLRRKFKKTDGKVNIAMEVRSDLAELLDEAYDLYLSNLEKSAMQFEVITKDFFRDISKNMPGTVKYFVWRIDGRLVAFHLCLVQNGIFVAEYLGFDYSVAYKYHLYFIHFRDEMKWCIVNGIRKYETGALNYDPKKRLDFKFVPQYIYVKSENPMMNFFLGIVGRLVKPENFDPILKSMREKSKK